MPVGGRVLGRYDAAVADLRAELAEARAEVERLRPAVPLMRALLDGDPSWPDHPIPAAEAEALEKGAMAAARRWLEEAEGEPSETPDHLASSAEHQLHLPITDAQVESAMEACPLWQYSGETSAEAMRAALEAAAALDEQDTDA
jgi:hypothetical protein